MLGGGGSASAYETGYFWGLLNYDTPENIATGKYEYDMVTGVSGGSINAIAFAGWKKGDEKNLADWLTEAWRHLHTKDVFKLWSGWDPIRKGLFEESGVLDDGPLTNKMNEIIAEVGALNSNDFERMIRVDAMDANSGSLIGFTEKDVAWKDFAKVNVASASLPGVFPSTKYGDHVFIDGGVVWGANLAGAVNKCRDVVDSDNKIVVDMLITHASSKQAGKESKNALTNYMRSKAIKDYWNGVAALRKFIVDFPNVTYRHFAIPSENIGPGPTRLDFEDNFTWHMQEVGRKDCKRDL